MPFKPLPEPASFLILALCSVSMTGCVSTPHMPTILAALDCASLIPDSYRKPIPPTPRLSVGAVVGDLGRALDGQTASLDQANGRTSDVIAMADSCKAHQDAVLKTLVPARPWWKFWAVR